MKMEVMMSKSSQILCVLKVHYLFPKPGFNNKITMHAVANPDDLKEPINRGEGFGVIKYKKSTREIIMECWPRNVDITSIDAKQYEGWPIIINQYENYNKKPIGYLPK